jgi:hypothetical protein
MKTNIAVIIFLFIILSAFSLNNTFNINAPSMKIDTRDVIYEAGEIVYFTINICSSDYLEYFEVSPDIIGCNNDSKVNLNFNNETKAATINYFYVIPENLKDVNKINISFIIRDKQNERILEKEILLK